MDYVIFSLHVGGASSILASINFVRTSFLMRPGVMVLLRTRMFV